MTIESCGTNLSEHVLACARDIAGTKGHRPLVCIGCRRLTLKSKSPNHICSAFLLLRELLANLPNHVPAPNGQLRDLLFQFQLRHCSPHKRTTGPLSDNTLDLETATLQLPPPV
jgi:hypothetical protein